PNFVIKGTVTDAETGRPVAGAKVGDTKEYNGGKFCTIADPNGHYEYKTWYEEHGVTAEADGYKRQGKGFGTKLFGSEKEKVINFELTKNSELKAKNFTATLPSGVTVELVGVCEHPSDGKQWWNPDGLLMGELVFELKGRRPYDKPYFGYMLQFEPPEDLTFRTSTDVDAFISTSSINTKGQAIAWLGYNEGHSNTPEIPETARITVKVAGGDWQTREPGKYEVFRDIVNFDDERILLSGLRSDPDDSKQTLIEATASGDDIDIKLVCVTKNGKSHEVTHSGMLRAGGKMIQHSFSLRAPIDEIEKIIVNYRKFHTVTFKNVSLRPNGKTEGRIKTEEQELKTTETDAKETRQETFNDILKSESRWDIIRRLNTWETALSAGDIETLERIVQETTHNDWEMNYSARSLLRRNLPRKYNVTPEVANAEEFFVKLRDGKVSSGAYDKFVDDIAGIGNDIVPMLLDMLKYDKPHDFYRENIAIKALGHMQDIRIIPALKKAIVSEEHRNQLEQIILSILRSDSSNAMVDYVASVIVNQKSSFDQEYIIRLISQSNTPYEAKKRLYFHYAEFKDYGKRAVIRGYGKMDDQEAFTQLVRILREDKYGGEFRVAVNELNNLKNSDPSAIFFEYLKKVPDHVCDDLIIPLAERNYLPAIPVLEERITNAGDSVDGARCKVWATGALCKLGKDYEKNSAIIREHLKKEYDPHAIGYAAYGVAGWLNDEETIKLLSQKICSENSNTDVLKWSIKALGQIGDKSALTALREALTILPLDLFIDIAEAIEAIGHDHNDQEIISEGKIIQTVTRTLRNTGGQQIVFAPGSPEANIRQRNYEKTLEWLAQHREVGTNIIKNLDSSWNKDAIIELIKTNVEN
ncbi:MAG: hypothetical protein ISS71_09110, partial [Phycisphaerae bacterium]|nr:hypothetical protein [Phycisphaerae bacterium]